MSATELQRVVVRMLHDPALVAAVYADADAALAGVPLSATERAWLVAPDRRRWGADPHRRARQLHALLDEYPASGALAGRGVGVARLDAFFSSSAFHGCIQARGSLALAFGAYLADLGVDVAAVARIEWAVARVRRAPPRPIVASSFVADSPDVAWRLAPWVDAFVAAPGALRRQQQLAAWATSHPQGAVGALLDPTWRLPPAPEADAPTGLLVERGVAGGVGIGEVDADLAALLADRRARTAGALIDALVALGAGSDEAPTLAAEMVTDALLIPA